MPDLTPSDLVIMLCGVLSLYFALVFTFGRPRTWFKDPLGWVIFISSWGLVAFIFLISYAIIFGDRVDEVFRFAITFIVAIGLVGKIYNVHRERRLGRTGRPRASTTNKEQT